MERRGGFIRRASRALSQGKGGHTRYFFIRLFYNELPKLGNDSCAH